MPGNKPTRLRIAFISSGIVFFSVFLTIIILASIYYDSYTYPNDYAIVIDAGSSGSRSYVYSWKSGLKAYKGDNIRIEELSQCYKNPGIDKLKSKDEVVLYFNECLQKASKQIPNSRKDRTYIILAATAGMRLLDISNKNQSDLILEYIRDHFSKSEFLFKSNDQVKIIDGKDEGVYAWISANYFLEKFSKREKPESTIGTLDLGGASTQIAFYPSYQNENSSTTDNFFKNLRIYSTNYRTYSTSFLCWGTNQIYLIYQTYLIINNGYKDQVNAACLNSNMSVNLTTDSILKSPCSNGQVFKFSPLIDLNRLKTNNLYFFNGTSDPEQCEKEINDLFPDTVCPFGENKCSFNQFYLPDITENNKFYAFSSYYYQMVNSEALSGRALRKNFSGYEIETKRLCSLNYNELSEINSKLKPMILEEFLNTTCFFNLYITKLLSKYKIKSFDNLEFVNTINNYSIGWTLGYMIDLINREDFLPYELPPRNLKSEFFIPTIVISCIFCILGIFFTLFIIFKYK